LKRMNARNQDHVGIEKNYERYLMLLKPVRLRAEGFAEYYREVLLINNFVKPEISDIDSVIVFLNDGSYKKFKE